MFLSVLVSEQMIDIKKTTYGTFIKVLNYEVYQNPESRKKTTDMHTDIRTDVTTDVHTDVQHTNRDNHVDQENKYRAFFRKHKCTFTEEEAQEFIRLVEGGKSPFPDDDVENEYFRIVIQKRDE